jgi:hypothetical protein
VGVLFAKSDSEIDELRSYVRTGRLFAVQGWIAARKPVFRKDSRKQQPLQIAVLKGFHSMVEILVEVWPDQETLDGAMNLAAEKRRVDLVWLLLNRGADCRALDMYSVAACNNKELMRFVFQHWADIAEPESLADLIICRPHPLIGEIRAYAPRIPESQKQLAMALKYFVKWRSQKWIALAIWMGANPRLPAPALSCESGNAEYCTSAVQDAVVSGDLETLKQLKPSQHLDDLNSLLADASYMFNTRVHVVEHLLECGATLNNKSNGGSTIIDSIFQWVRFRFGGCGQQGFGVEDLKYLKKWINRGARWVPDDKSSYRDVRLAIQDQSTDDAWEFIEYLSETIDEALLFDVCNTPKTRKLLEVPAKQLSGRIAGIYERRLAEEARRNFFPRDPDRELFKQRRPGVLGIRDTRTSRCRLYRDIWSRPLTDIAAEYLVRTDELVAISRGYDIPRPRAGDWRKVEGGQSLSMEPLSTPEYDPSILIRSQGNLPDIASDEAREFVQVVLSRLATPRLEIEVPMVPQRTHDLLIVSGPAGGPTPVMRVSRPGGIVQIPMFIAPGICVREDMRERAIRVMNAILHFLEEIGCRLCLGESWRGGHEIEACLRGERARFRMEQEAARLKLVLGGSGGRTREAWRDGRRQLVEECIVDFAAHLVYAIGVRWREDRD